MNMTSVLHRRGKIDVIEEVPPATPDSIPPTLHPPSDRRPPSNQPWPASAKLLAALLAVAAALGIAGSAVGLSSGDDTAEARQLRERVDSLTVERDEALGAIAALDAEVESLRQQLSTAEAGSGELVDRIDALQADIVALTEQLDGATVEADELTDRIAALTTERDQAVAGFDELEAEVSVLQQRLTTARAERDALAKAFPVDFDASLGNASVVGKYRVSPSQVYCAGLTTCGKAPAISELEISKSPEGFLRLSIPGFATGGLFRADGALHTVVDSTTAVPACDGKVRTARVAVTVIPGVYEIGADGSGDIVNLGAVITVDAPATGSCPAGLAVYGATVTPKA